MEKIWSLFNVLRQQVFAMNLWKTGLLIVLFPAIWALLIASRSRKRMRRLSAMLLLFFVIGIILLTLLDRGGAAVQELILIPFVHLQEKGLIDEVARTFLMNVLLFVPFGLFLPGVLPDSWKTSKRMKITILTGLGISLIIELLQYLFSLGRAEVDDLIANTLGTFVGALHVQLAAFLRRLFASAEQETCHTN